MGQTISQRIERRGKRVTDAVWRGWIKKAGEVNKGWKHRYFMLESDRLYYFKEPHKKSKGYIPLADATGMCLLPHRPSTERSHVGHVPFVLCTNERVWMLGFDLPERAHEFIEMMQHYTRVTLASVVVEDWVMLQIDEKNKRWSRQFVVYVGTGDILVFADGSTMLLEKRAKVRDITNIQSQDSLHRTLQISLKNEVLWIEFDGQLQFDRWKLILTNALDGDIAAEAYTRRQKQLEQRKKLERRRRMKQKRRRTAPQRYRRVAEQLEVPDSIAAGLGAEDVESVTSEVFNDAISEVSSRSTKSSRSRRRSSKPKRSRGGRSRKSSPPPLPRDPPLLALPPPEEENPLISSSRDSEEAQKETQIVIAQPPASDPLLNVEPKDLDTVSNTLSRRTSYRSRGSSENSRSPNKSRRRRENQSSDAPFTAFVESHDVERLQWVRRKRFSKQFRSVSPMSREIPMVEMKASPGPKRRAHLRSRDLVDAQVGSARRQVTRARSQDLDDKLTQAGFPEFHSDLEKTFETLYKRIQKKHKRSDQKLRRQLLACAHAIDHLGSLLPQPHSPCSSRFYHQDPHWNSGDWYTKDPAGGLYVRHWIHRSSLD